MEIYVNILTNDNKPSTEWFIINSFFFEKQLLCESLNNHKIWKRWKDWDLYFVLDIPQIFETKEGPKKVFLEDKLIMNNWNSQFVIFEQELKFIHYHFNKCTSTTSWKFISQLLKDERKYLHKIIVNTLGEMGDIFLSTFSNKDPLRNLEKIPLLERDFEKTERGNYIARFFGKILFSPVNKTGVYKIINNKENYAFLKLEEEIDETPKKIKFEEIKNKFSEEEIELLY